ncbi:helix-turn-helix domain-containing protein [Fulvivirgaceae bacterium PWU4]|jgi:transcriptional regulator GlxA family with amidase domain|uniref:Helix-turn-helix domain-containing protein n=1 Tax=Chryseosolibacter histidini TaxID=2782349 RepID=A0AAP2GNK6_9BACT|nr:helix-turn-helix domain-containing protein [Chryseosolibacter histidini]MBT1696622.1 helix-turn-helix domain-containing protein [Chryseosolibacter histidini]
MRHISILVPKGAVLGSIEGPRQLFTQVNQFFKAKGEPPVFKVQLVGLEKETPLCGGLVTIHADTLLNDVEKTDLVIIPAVDGEMKAALEANKEFIPWITKQYKAGAEVASLCLGAFILASTGLLNGRKAATHWLAANDFRKMFPEVNLMAEKVITDERGLYSSGGAYSYLNLVLYLIEKYVGREMAILNAKVFAIEIERESQSPFIIFQGQKEHEDEPIKKAQEFIENNFQEKITVDQLASMLALGRRNLERRFKKATSNTLVEYIQRVKIEAAKMSLETSRENVNEVMYKVGYTDTKAFRTTFKRITGLSPIEYRNKYNREMIAA